MDSGYSYEMSSNIQLSQDVSKNKSAIRNLITELSPELSEKMDKVSTSLKFSLILVQVR